MGRAGVALLAIVLLESCGASAWLAAPAWSAEEPQAVETPTAAHAAPLGPCCAGCQIVGPQAGSLQPAAQALPAAPGAARAPAAPRGPARVDVLAGILGIVTGNPAAWSLGAQLIHLIAGTAASRRRRKTT